MIKYMNILTFDIEEWYLEFLLHGGRAEKYQEYDKFLNLILDKLDERGIKATFFCVGGMGREFPAVVKKIYDRGHEIGCHSNVHTWLNKMTVEECRQDTKAAVDSLEQCIGRKVLSYRAPAFSIGESNKWAFEILAENGIERDASVFPAVRDFGGFPNFSAQKPVLISYNGITIKEFPVPMISFAGKKVAYSGGGYFRFFPLPFIRKQMEASDYVMTYFHISDLLPESKGVMTMAEYEAYFKEPGTVSNRYKRFVKANLGKKGALDKLMRLIDDMDFMSLDDVDGSTDWAKSDFVLR